MGNLKSKIQAYINKITKVKYTVAEDQSFSGRGCSRIVSDKGNIRVISKADFKLKYVKQ